jgi:hypothetical protein
VRAKTDPTPLSSCIAAGGSSFSPSRPEKTEDARSPRYAIPKSFKRRRSAAAAL